MRALLFSDPSNLPKLVSASKDIAEEIHAITWEKIAVPVDRLEVIKGALVNDCWVSQLHEEIKTFDLMLMPATRDSKEIASRLAAKRGLPYISGALSLKASDGLLTTRVVFGGRGIEELKISMPAVITVNLDVYEPSFGEPKSVEERKIECSSKISSIKERERKTDVDLTKAQVIISVGRGLKKKEDLSMIKELASLLGAEISCTRPISADLKWLPEERHVGMTGVKVKPKIYLALGISGQIQHAVGFRDADTVIAVNTDPDAPISEISDYFIVENLYEFVPKLIKAIREKRKEKSN